VPEIRIIRPHAGSVNAVEPIKAPNGAPFVQVLQVLASSTDHCYSAILKKGEREFASTLYNNHGSEGKPLYYGNS